MPTARDHFLFQALLSVSLPIRQHASLQLIRAADDADRISILTNVLWDMVRDEMDDFLKVATDRRSPVMTLPGEGDGSELPSQMGDDFLKAERIVQMYGLLVHFITEHDDIFYRFLLQGGLDWVCQRVLALVRLLIPPVHDVPSSQEWSAKQSTYRDHPIGKEDNKAESKTQESVENTSSSHAMEGVEYSFLPTPQTKWMTLSLAFEEQVKKRLYIFADFCSRITIVSEEKNKVRHEAAYEWFWKRKVMTSLGKLRNPLDDGDDEGDLKNKTLVRSLDRENVVEEQLCEDRAGIHDISPLGCILAAALVLKRSASGSSDTENSGAVMSLTAEDYVIKPEKNMDSVTWILGRIVDTRGELVIVQKDRAPEDSKKNSESAVNSVGFKKRKRVQTSVSQRLGNEQISSSNESALDDLDERLLSQSSKRQRFLQQRSRNLVSSLNNASINNVETGERALGEFSSAAEVLTRNTTSSLERNADDTSRLLPASLERLMALTMANNNVSAERQNDNDHHGNNNEDEKSADEERSSNPFDAYDDGDEDDDEDDDDDDDDIESDPNIEDSEENNCEDDEEIESEDEDEANEEEEDEEDEGVEGHILDDFIVDVGSNPFQSNNHLMVVDAELENIRSSLSATNQRLKEALRQRKTSDISLPPISSTGKKTKPWRTDAFIRASIELLNAQYPTHHHYHNNHSKCHLPTRTEEGATLRRGPRLVRTRGIFLTPTAEQELLQAICHIVRPPKEPLKLKVLLRRAPTQEEFFRGSLSQNPILIASLKGDLNTSSSSEYEPTVKDLRQHIANDLQMADSAELLELLVANKILDLNLKLRVVAQTTWRNHILESNVATEAESSFRRLMSASIFGDGSLFSRSRFDENSPISDLPPMVVTYRLAGVDGEATEDKIEENDLDDPDATPTTNSSSAEYEAKMEKEYGVTRLISKGRGLSFLLRCLNSHLDFVLKRIRRDDIGNRSFVAGRHIVRKNKSRLRFLKAPPCPALTLLQYCAMIGDNRKKLINAQAPTILLRLVLDVLNSIDENSKLTGNGKATLSNGSQTSHSISVQSNNPTADALQTLIETLSSDISMEMARKTLVKTPSGDFDDADDISQNEEDEEEEASTLPILLSSLQTTSLSPPLRKVVAKLLPFLTYGQVAQSRALASQFLKHIQVSKLGTSSILPCKNGIETHAILMDTFVDAAIHLPPAAVCDTLRVELIRQGFVSNMINFVLSNIPSRPPPWSAALFNNTETLSENERRKLWEQWALYYERNGISIGLKILIGLSTDHKQTQSYLASVDSSVTTIPLLVAAHWIESTSDKDGINTNGLGILAETMLDTMMNNNEDVERKVTELRKKTRNRKKELAQEQRKKALAKMGGFGTFSSGTPEIFKSDKASLPSNENLAKASSIKPICRQSVSENKPSWMLEMEAMEDESGLVCSICQEGRNYKPTEILGLYGFMKKISIPHNRGGGSGNIDGTLLILSLPPHLPESLRGSEAEDEWYQPSMDLATVMKSSSHGSSTLAASSSSIMGSRSLNFITTVTAGNAIHCSCHARARTADRNHPKAPKSEWEGASLRNSRVSCNVIIPLMAKQNPKVPVMELESALTDHQQAVSNILGAKPKSMLWTILHDIRLLVLRIAHGEALNVDCGGGSLSSNASLIFHDLFLAQMFARNAEHDNPGDVLHAKGLSTAYLAASSILRCSDLSQTAKTKQLRRAFADCAPMAAICCILFQNSMNDEDVLSENSNILSTDNSPNIPPPKRRWEMHKSHFLAGLLQCAGRRHAQGVEGSGCITGRRVRSSSLSDWNEEHSNLSPRRHIGKRNSLTVEEYGKIMRPMLILYAILDHLSNAFTLQMDDEVIEKCSHQLVNVIESCQKAGDIRSLLSHACITLDDTTIIEEVEAGINTVS